ncbi:MAG: exo-alpha-sialidase [Armatimonadetes bacterium]|nr:exo-alpha-sialidase [Armatimonadota bacterium]
MGPLAMGAIVLTSVGAGAQTGRLETREIEVLLGTEEPILREDFERCEPRDAVLRDERRDDSWLLRTKDWPTPLLNAVGNPPDLTYDPQLTGAYDIYLGSRATHFTVSVGLKLGGEPEFTVVTSPRGTEQVHYDWEYCFRRGVKLDGEKLVIRSLGHAAYLDYLKFVPVEALGKGTARVATDHVMVCSEAGKHFAFPGVARLTDGSLGAVFREGTAHVDPSGGVAWCRSTDGGRTWSPRKTIYDDPNIDERDPAVLQHSGGALIVSMHSGSAVTIRSTDGGETWDKPTVAPVFSPHGPRELPDGRIYWCGIVTRMGTNQVQIAVSEDLGLTWDTPITVGLSLPYHQPWVRPFWDEPFALPLSGDEWLCLHRVDMDGYLYANRSAGGGATFGLPERTRMWGCPPFVLRLHDGRLLALYGYRRPPWGIRGCLSADEGATWDAANEIVLREDGGHGDLGYPVALEVEPGLVFAVYYHNRGGEECTIEGTFLRL